MSSMRASPPTLPTSRPLCADSPCSSPSVAPNASPNAFGDPEHAARSLLHEQGGHQGAIQIRGRPRIGRPESITELMCHEEINCAAPVRPVRGGHATILHHWNS